MKCISGSVDTSQNAVGPTSEWTKLTGQICLALAFQRKRSGIKQFGRLNSGLTGPICARGDNLHILRELDPRGHHDWPVQPT
ncbi:MAG: hypothetical protein NT090_14655, partial [Acidobacteria bacterium]|nr:hypothetical protein [Acidobacteriota bacterium]